MSLPKKELPIPGIAKKDREAFELLRVWVAKGDQHVVLATEVWADPAAWGIMLVDLAKHIANAYAQESKFEHADALERIKAGFDAEWQHATDDPRGMKE